MNTTEKNKDYDVLFFMRAYNDVDHLSPVAYKLKQLNSNLKIACILSAVDKDFSNDFRLNFLKNNNIEVLNIFNILKVKRYRIYSNILKRLRIEAVYKHELLFRVINKVILRPIENWLLSRLNRRDSANNFLELFNSPPKLFVFDHSGLPFYLSLINNLDEKNIPSVAIPHGHDIFSNEMIKNHMM